jgi:membrane protein implicated in regulation of membrane protease activity
MAGSDYWWLLAIALGVVELLTGTFWMLVLAAGAVAAAIAGLVGLGLAAQLAVGAAVVVVGAVLVRKLRPFGPNRPEPSRNPDVNQDIGARIAVPRWGADGLARVSYRGASWEVELLPGEPVDAGQYVVREVSGSRLRLAADNEFAPSRAPTSAIEE